MVKSDTERTASNFSTLIHQWVKADVEDYDYNQRPDVFSYRGYSYSFFGGHQI
jgi:hypothetical protein